MRRTLLGIAAVATAIALTVTATASARAGDRSFTETYPVASALCAKAASATLPPKLAPAAMSVSAACDKLENAFPTLVSIVDTAEATLLDTVSTQKGLVATACSKPVTNPTTCATVRASAKSTDLAARSLEQTAVVGYHTAVEANRMTFWHTISTLR
jgi:hypothetical protein